MNKKRFLAALLTLVILVGMFPSVSLAADWDAYAPDRTGDEVEYPMVPVTDDTPQRPEFPRAARPLAAETVDTTGLVNITSRCAITTKSDSSDKPKENLYDGNYATLWGQSSTFPGEVTFGLPQNAGKVKTIILSFEQGHPAWGMDITLTADGVQADQQTVASFDDKYIYTFQEAQTVSSLKIGLTNPTNNGETGGFWPALAEAEIWTEPQPVDLSTLTNIAKGMSPTLPNNNRVTDGSGNPKSNLTDDENNTEFEMYGSAVPTQAATGPEGNSCFMDFDFGENRSVGGFEFVVSTSLATSYSYKYNIYGKADGASQWTEYVKDVSISHAVGENAKKHPLTALASLRYVRVVIHSGNQWGALSEFRIFGEAKEDPDDPYEGLVEVAALSEVKVPGGEDTAGNLIDGNLSSLWNRGSGTWPTDVDFALPGNLNIKRVEIDFEKVANRSMKILLSRAVNNVTTEYQPLYTSALTAPLTDTFVYDMSEAQAMTHLRVTLSSPNPSTLWPAIAEVRIYAVDETIDLSKYDDITSYAEATSGADYKMWDFGGNQQIVGFTATLPQGVTAVLKGKMKRDASWTTHIAQLVPGENVFQFAKGMSAVRVELSDPSQLTDFHIFGTYSAPVTDSGSLAFEKPAHSNFNNATLYLVNDGDTTNQWRADMYPSYVDIDLEQNCDLTGIEVYTPTSGYTQYTLYTSLNGRDFDLVASKLDNLPCTAQGDSHQISAKARFVRVYLEYYSASAQPILNEVRVIGTPSQDQTNYIVDAQDVTPFAGSQYDPETHPITSEETINEVKGIIERQVGSNYVNWFTFALAEDADGYDYFTLSDENGKVKVTGNSGVSLATGVNHYLKYFCNVHISQVGNQVNMPDSVVAVGAPVHKETRFPVRYAYNYCTHSYSMAFWGEDEWRNELDWLALNGVNVVLDITGQEEVWREFLMSVGFSHQEAKDFLAGPGYYAWAYMANLTGFGGPVHDSYLTSQVELARKNQRVMRALGMEPVLQAFSGMVPVEIATHDPSADIIPQGVWCSFQRPTMLKTDTATYDEYAAKFYAAQKRVFGDAKYYATDPFHEGGNTGGMNTTLIASELLDSLIDFDSDAVWVIQSWQGNPSNGLLAGLRNGTNPTREDRRDHALVLDLYAERDQNWQTYGVDTDGDGLKEFSDTPWVFCQLNNFGSRMGLHGYLDALQKNIPNAANTAQHMVGIGISPEGSQENPLLYDFLFETIWTQDAAGDLPVMDLDQWLNDYALRRYGAVSANAEEALFILAETVYKDSIKRVSSVKQGAPESVVNARPALDIGAASTWGYSYIYYDKTKLQDAARLLLADYDTLSASDAYLYDLADVLKQVLSNTAQYIHGKMADAYRAKDQEEFNAQSEKFLALIDLSDQIMGTRKEFLFGTWTENASQLAQNTDDFTQRLYLRNAKALVTTWGAIQQCNTGGLKDYSNRQWAGLTKDYYKARWVKWIDQAKANLAAGNNGNINVGNWFPWEWEYARDPVSYSTQTNGLSLKVLGQQVLDDFTIVLPPEEDASSDIPPAEVAAVKAGSQHVGSDENDACENVLDNNTGTIWHTEWNGTVNDSDKWIAFDLGRVRPVDGLRYQPRQSQSTGRITSYKVFVSSSESDWNGATDGWTEVASGSWANNGSWKKASFTTTNARYVKLLATGGNNNYYSASEIRVTTTPVRVTGLTLAPSSATLYANAGDPAHSISLTAVVAPENATNKAVSWRSNSSRVATVNNGVVTAVGVGSATITATTEDGSFRAACSVTVKQKIEGTVTISGKAEYGATLTANLNTFDQIAKENLDVQWFRGQTPIGGATEKTYSLTEDDIGQTITVKVTAKAPYEGESSATTAVVDKAEGLAMKATPTHRNVTGEGKTDGAITGLFKGRKYQYLLWDRTELPGEDADWQDFCDSTGDETNSELPYGTAEITGLGVGSYVVRRAADGPYKAGPISKTVTIVVQGAAVYELNNPHDFEGGVIQAGRDQIPANDTVTLWAIPKEGYQLASLTATYPSEDGVAELEVTPTDAGTYTFTMPAAPVTISASFVLKTYTITHDLTNITCDMAEHDHTATHGERFSITLTPDEGHEMPRALTLTNTDTGAEFQDYTYLPHVSDPAKRVLTFAHGVTGNITISGSGVKKVYTVVYDLTHLTADSQPSTATHGEPFTAAISATEGCILPQTITVTIGGIECDAVVYDPTSGLVTIPASAVTGNIIITATAVPVSPTFQYTIVYDLAGGSLTEENPTSYTMESDSFTLHNPIRSGYTFAGWIGTGLSQATLTVTIPAGSFGSRSYIATWRARGSSSGSGSTGTTTTETKEDGTKVTTTTKHDGSVIQVTETPDGVKETVETKSNGTVTETVETPDGAKTEKVTIPDKGTTLTVTDAEGEQLAKVELPAALPEAEIRFDDVPEGHWADEAIHHAAALELVKGVGGVGVNLYHMNDPMTRGSLATVLHRLSQGKTDYEITFQDVAEGKYYTEGVAWAAKAGVVAGISDSEFAPDDAITREQLAVMMARYAKLLGLDTQAGTGSLERFADGGETGSWAVDGVAWCVKNGILRGKGNDLLDPTAQVSRAEVAVMLDRFIALLK